MLNRFAFLAGGARGEAAAEGWDGGDGANLVAVYVPAEVVTPVADGSGRVAVLLTPREARAMAASVQRAALRCDAGHWVARGHGRG